jgi:hypothetical protein
LQDTCRFVAGSLPVKRTFFFLFNGDFAKKSGLTRGSEFTMHQKVDLQVKLVFLRESTKSKKRQTRRCFMTAFKSETVKLVKQSDRAMTDLAIAPGISREVDR